MSRIFVVELMPDPDFYEFMRSLLREQLTEENFAAAEIAHLEGSRSIRREEGYLDIEVVLSLSNLDFFLPEEYPPDIELLKNEIGVAVKFANGEYALLRYTQDP